MIEQGLYVPHSTEELQLKPQRHEGDLPVPPIELMEYGESPEHHLETGRRDMRIMTDALANRDSPVDRCERILEFGCANGRMMRWLDGSASEIWGVDVQAEKIFWAAEHLSPPFNFATTTTIPHLPFPDNHFDLVFAFSVFTHLCELHVAWFLELTRILKPDGRLYVTVHDEASVQAAFDDEGGHLHKFGAMLKESEAAESLGTGEFGFVSVAPYGQAMLAQVMMSRDYVEHVTRPFLRLDDAVPNAYSEFQTGYVFTPRQA